MPSYIVKPIRDRDEYVVWSTVVDAPTLVGTRAELGPELLEVYGYQAGDPARFDRADEKGTSALGSDFGWDDEDGEWFWIGNHNTWSSPVSYKVHRSDLAEFARADAARDAGRCLEVLVVIDDEEE